MLKNLEQSQGSVYSSQILLALVQKGLSREDAYKRVQALSHSMEAGETLMDKCLQDSEISKILGKANIRSIFSGKALQEKLAKQVSIYLKDQKRI
jgi:adenylosuccinate lyase